MHVLRKNVSGFQLQRKKTPPPRPVISSRLRMRHFDRHHRVFRVARAAQHTPRCRFRSVFSPHPRKKTSLNYLKTNNFKFRAKKLYTNA
jgi:hypothetical protein